MRLNLFSAATAVLSLTLVACGGRVPPAVQLSTTHFVGSWIKADDWKNNSDADGGKDTIIVTTIQSNLEVLEEVRDPAKSGIKARSVGQLRVGPKVSSSEKEATIVYDKAKLKEAAKNTESKIGKRSEEEVERLIKQTVNITVQIDQNKALVTADESKDGVVTRASTASYVKLTPEMRKQLKLPEQIDTKPVDPNATPTPTPKPPGGGVTSPNNIR